MAHAIPQQTSQVGQTVWIIPFRGWHKFLIKRYLRRY